MNRRSLLALAGATIATGCTGPLQQASAPHRAVGADAWTDRRIETRGDGEIIRGTVTLGREAYTAQSAELYGSGGRIEIGIEAVDSRVDVLTVRDRDVAAYRQAGSITPITTLSEAGIDAPTIVAGSAPPRTYWVVFDNTSVWGRDPIDSVTLDVSVAIGVG